MMKYALNYFYYEIKLFRHTMPLLILAYMQVTFFKYIQHIYTEKNHCTYLELNRRPPTYQDRPLTTTLLGQVKAIGRSSILKALKAFIYDTYMTHIWYIYKCT